MKQLLEHWFDTKKDSYKIERINHISLEEYIENSFKDFREILENRHENMLEYCLEIYNELLKELK